MATANSVPLSIAHSQNVSSARLESNIYREKLTWLLYLAHFDIHNLFPSYFVLDKPAKLSWMKIILNVDETGGASIVALIYDARLHTPGARARWITGKVADCSFDPINGSTDLGVDTLWRNKAVSNS
jgi:hypothetical protein